MHAYKKLIFLILVGLSFKTYAQQDIEIKAITTGYIFGKVIQLDVQNNSQTDYVETIQPFYLPAMGNHNAYLISEPAIFRLAPGERKSYYLTGYLAHIDAVKRNAGSMIPWPEIIKYADNPVKPYDSLVATLHTYNTQKLNDQDLIPFDFIMTHPGSHEMLGYTFDLEKNMALSNPLLAIYMKNLDKAYMRLHKAGKIVTHFNNDPLMEKNIILQIAYWITTAGLEGDAVKKADIKHVLLDFYKAMPAKEKDFSHFKNSFSRYFNIIDRLGIEGRSYITPAELDRNPQCLPEMVGFKPTHDAVKTPVVMVKRYDFYPVMNQRFLPGNDCLPCSIRKNRKEALLSFICLRGQSDIFEKFVKDIEKLTDENPPLKEYYLSGLMPFYEFEPLDWTRGKEVAFADKSKVAFNYFEKLIDANLEKVKLQKLENDLAQKYLSDIETVKGLFQDLLFLQENGLEHFNLDCCDRLEQGQAALDEIIATLNHLARKNWQATEPSMMPDLVLLENTLRLSLIKTYDLLEDFAPNRQFVCLPDTGFAGETEIRSYIKSYFGLEQLPSGTYKNQRYIIKISEKDRLLFVFGNCNCGRYRESTIPFLKLKPSGKQTVTSVVIRKQRIVPKHELSFRMGTIIAQEGGAEKFDGGGLEEIDNVIKINDLDTLFKIKFGPGYQVLKAENFKFTKILDYRFAYGLDIWEHFQARLNFSTFKGYVEADQQVRYYDSPNDTQLLTGLLRSQLNAISFGGGVRYYLGDRVKPYLGVNLNYSIHNSSNTRLYLEELELSLKNLKNHSLFQVSMDAGCRYNVNQLFFLEANASLINRFDQNDEGNEISAFDIGLNAGIGMKF